MADLSHGNRWDRLERVAGILAEDQLELQKIVAEMAKEGRAMREEFRAEARMRREEDDRIRAEMRERASHSDERVDKLVLAIGEFIRRQDRA